MSETKKVWATCHLELQDSNSLHNQQEEIDAMTKSGSCRRQSAVTGLQSSLISQASEKKNPTNKQTNKNIKPFLKKKFNIEVMHMNAI